MGFGPFPSCAKRECGWPGLAKIEFVDDGRPTFIFLCLFHIWEAPDALSEMSTLREAERELLEDGTREPERPANP
jgi:hypothetical protein